jgi:plasmid stability protein
MAISMMPLLIHSESLSNEVRAALKAAVVAAPEVRPAQLETAARMLHRESSLDCREVRDLMGLGPKCGC